MICLKQTDNVDRTLEFDAVGPASGVLIPSLGSTSVTLTEQLDASGKYAKM